MPNAGELPTLRVRRFLTSTTDATVLTIAHNVGLTETKTRLTVKHLKGAGQLELTCTNDTGSRRYGITEAGRALTDTNEEN